MLLPLAQQAHAASTSLKVGLTPWRRSRRNSRTITSEIAVLYAESVMDLSPWNYWQPGGHAPNERSGPIVPTLEYVLARDPNHPGAIHFTSTR
jgi:hypothetical protein